MHPIWGLRWLTWISLLLFSVDAQIRIMAPSSLVNAFSVTSGKVGGSTATFGAPFYGDRYLGRLVYGESKFGLSHCKNEDYDLPQPAAPVEHEQQEIKLIHIAIVRRGNCTFVTKVKVAEAKGAHAVIIVDKADSGKTTRDINRIIVADDGYGQNVRIPSMLVAPTEGQLLIDAAKDISQQVVVELAWDVPTDNVVKVDLWMSSGSRESFRFLREWSPKRKALNEVIKFVPHFSVFGMVKTGDLSDLCWPGSSEYCAEDPDAGGPITGKIILEEDVRLLCLHELYKVKRDTLTQSQVSHHVPEFAKEFWDYVEVLHTDCPLSGATPDTRLGPTCANSVLRKVGADVAKVEKCVSETALDKLKQQRAEVAWSPRALRINGWRFLGALDAELVTRAVCAGFVELPAACQSLVQPHIQVWTGQPDTVTVPNFLMALGGIALCAVCALCFYKRSLTKHIHSALREEVMLEVQAQMDSYRQMTG